jgi:hypothetical protein
MESTNFEVPHWDLMHHVLVLLNTEIYVLIFKDTSRDSSVGIATGYWLDGLCSIIGSVQTGCGA